MALQHLFRSHRGIILALAACILPNILHAQIAGELKGRVLDATGASVAGAHITLTQNATGVQQSAVTTSDGLYDFAQLVSGTYRIDVVSDGFKPFQQNGVSIATGQTVGLDLPLPIGGVQELVVVNADAPLLQSQTSNIQTTIQGGAIQALPLNSRNFIQLAQLAPGVALPPGTLLPRINGGRPRTNEYLFDGISALQPEPGQVAFFPILDDIAEFTVEANNVPAEFGRFNGGVVNVGTRSGSNAFHGSLFEYIRNEDLNARNYFATGTAPTHKYRRNLFGATVGGPVLRDKLFFFADYQGILQRIGVTRISTVPTLAERAGNFSGVSKIYNPNSTTTVGGRLSRTEFPNDTINTPLDPAAVALLARYPVPLTTAAANNYSRVATDDDHQQQFDVRIDGARGQHDRAFARYTYYHEVEQPATPLPDGSGAITGSVINAGNVAGLTHITGQQIVLSETHTFSPTVVNNLHVGYTRRGNTQAGTSLNGSASNALGIPGIPTNAAFNNALPLFSITGFTQLGQSASTFSRYQTAVGELNNTIIWTKAAHSFKAGIDARRYELNAIAPPNPTGSFAFTTTGTNTTAVAPATAASTGGNALASFLLGQVDTFSIDLQTRTIRPRDYIYEFFVQDDWRLLPNLVLNAGLRWTLHLPSTETHNQGAVFNLATQQLDYLGVNGNSRSARELHWDNVAPRFGFAYSVDHKTIIRSGFGIVFIDQSGITTPFTTPQYPFIQNVQQKTTDSYTRAFQLANGPTVSPIALTPDAGLGQSVYTATKKAGSGYVQQWNLAVQRSITNNLSFDIAYVGSHIVHVGIPDSNLNQLTAAQLAQGSSLTAMVANPYFGLVPASSPLGTKTIAAGQLLKPYPRFQNVSIYRNNTGETNYNAIEAKVEERVSHNLSFLFAYTHSKLIDDASSVFSSTVLSSPNSSSLIAADTYRPYLERDSSSGDMPNVTTFSVNYALPKRVVNRTVTTVLGGWTVNAIMTLQSGMPITVTQSTNTNSFAGVALMRPMLIANPSLPSNQRMTSHFFNTAAFATTPQFQFGNASRNPVRGPAYRDADLSLVKHTAVGDKTDIELRAELFNVTNTPGFAQPSGAFGTAAFGTITATVTDPRVAQFALRISR
jgi:hypothetical protein